MNKLIKSSLYKLLRDWTFKVTLILGAALAVFMCSLYFLIDLAAGDGSLEAIGTTCYGYSFYISSLSPTQNFGLAVPINLIIFTIGEFNCGTIRNKIIAGNKKTSIYLSLVLTGIIFTLSLMIIYFALSVGLSSLIGGFNGKSGGNYNKAILYQYPLMALCTYIFIVTFCILVSSSIRNIGGSMPIVIILIMFLYFIAFIPTLINELGNKSISNFVLFQRWANPMYTFGAFSLGSILSFEIDASWFAGSLVTPIYWSIINIMLGILVFKKKDVK